MRTLFSFLIALSLGFAPLVHSAESVRESCLATLESEIGRQELAESVGLTYLSTRPTGITRRVHSRIETQNGKKKTLHTIEYFDPDGAPITDPEQIERFQALRIPPAYQDVWISADPNTHVLAASQQLRNQPDTCRQYYIHPLVLAKYADPPAWAELSKLRDEEALVLALLGQSSN